MIIALSAYNFKRIVWIVLLVACIWFLARRTIAQRRNGKSWNDALADGVKLVTGNVWLDGALFAVVLLGICILLFYALYRK